ncbi:helix-turn-helix domain-containing protein [Pedobacter sp. MC2016-24]|uniref:helix-turn-helix domain-containing protein n=1 Tax=Pedobacter sp. MC2016-24 TaxID=2780090 RepID=UPI00187F1BFC|nr:helix-turn-helix transcriptional regulator [Pedobacter sp. MC2016-24]MBE9598639.1 helix-turn-helix transcriptional regulator [Pedobacter sp. MC2016-24]
MNFGEKIKELREDQGLLQRQLAANLEIDTPMFSKIERGERKAKREQVEQLALLLHVDRTALFSIWLADQILDLIQNEPQASEAIEIVKKELKKA